MLPESTLWASYEAADLAGNLKHQIMPSALRHSRTRFLSWPLLALDIDLEARKILIEHGKGDKDRYILLPESFRLVLKAYMPVTRT